MKIKKQDIFNCILIALIPIVILFIAKGEENIFGNTYDWFEQHVSFPAYFRDLFYQTGDLLPDFALAIGAGQNIYNFAYYGLLNPIILISYLLPFVQMADYIMISSIILLVLSGILCYKWILNNIKDRNIAFISALFLVVSGSMLVHTTKHIMFVNYMPFLILALMSVDRYFKKRTGILLSISLFLMIMTSYYYSVIGIVAVAIYALYKLVLRLKIKKFKFFLHHALKFALYFLFGILLAAFLILPVAYTIFSGRTAIASEVNLISLLKPKFNLVQTLDRGTAYSLGVSIITFVSLMSFPFIKKKAEWILNLSVIFFALIPIFLYLFNGGLYARTKVLIPFLPIVCFIVAKFLFRIANKKIKLLKFIPYILLMSFIFLEYRNKVYVGELILIIVLMLGLKFTSKKLLFLMPLLIFPIYLSTCKLDEEGFMSKEIYDSLHSQNDEYMVSIVDEYKGLYRVGNDFNNVRNINEVLTRNYNITSIYSSIYNDLYMNFNDEVFKNSRAFRNILCVSDYDNILYSMFMGVKYKIMPRSSIGYKKFENIDHIYENKDVLPMMYVSDNLMSYSEFKKLKYPYTVEALLKSTVVEQNLQKNELKFDFEKANLKYEIIGDKTIIKEKNQKYSLKKGKLRIKFDENMKNKILIIKFNVNSPNNVTIKMNNITNKLFNQSRYYKNHNDTFVYVIGDGKNYIDVEINDNVSEIANIETYIIDYNAIKNIKDNVDEFKVNMKESKGDVIKGYISTQKNGYFVTSIPYDEGFVVKVNGEKVPYEKVNTAFLGFKLESGDYEVTIEYKAPWKTAGIIISLCSVIGLVLMQILDKKLDKHKK